MPGVKASAQNQYTTMLKRIEKLLRHYNHPKKRLIIEILTENQPGGLEVTAVTRKLQKELRETTESEKKHVGEYIRQLRMDGVIVRHPRTELRTYYYTNPDFINLINQLNEEFKNYPICCDSWPDNIPVYSAAMQKQPEQKTDCGGCPAPAGEPEQK